jgi:hypothetical protein
MVLRPKGRSVSLKMLCQRSASSSSLQAIFHFSCVAFGKCIQVDDAEKLLISDPIATLIRIEKKFWLCLGEVNGLQIDGHPVDKVSFKMLEEETVTVSYQMLGL